MESSNHIVKMDREEFVGDIESAEARGGFSALIRSYEIHARKVSAQDDVEYLLEDLVRRLTAAANDISNPLVSARYLERAAEVTVSLLEAPEEGLQLFKAAFRRAPSRDMVHRAHALLVGKLRPEQLGTLEEARWKTTEGESKAEAGLSYTRTLLETGRVDEAVVILEKVVEESPDYAPAQSMLRRLALGASGEKGVDALEEQLAGAENDRERAEILVEAADGLADEQGEVAQQLYERSFEFLPTVENVSRLVAAFERQDDLDGKLQLYRDVVDRVESRDLLLEGRLALGHLAPPEEALEHLLWIREYEPRTPTILQLLAEVYRKQQDIEALIDVLVDLRSTTRIVAEARELDREVGLLCWKELADLDRAEPYFRKWRIQDPSAPQVKEFFTALARAREDWVSLLRSLRKSLADLEPTEQAPVLREIATVTREKLGSDEGALDALERLWRAQEGDNGAFDEMVAILTSNQKWTGLAALLEEGADKANALGDGKRELKLLRQFADLTAEDGEYPVLALHGRARERLMELDAPDTETLKGLLEEYRRTGAVGKLVRTLEALIPQLSEEGERIPLLKELGETLSSIEGRRQDAVPYLESYLEGLSVDDREVRRLLNQLYRSGRDVESLLESLRAEAAQLTGSERFNRMRELAFLLEGESGDLHGASEILAELVEAGEATAEERRHLRRLLEEVGDWPALAALLFEEGMGDGSKSLRVAALEKAGRVYFEEVGDNDKAREAYVQLLAISPFHGEAKTRLGELRGDDGDWSSLRSMYSESGDWTGYLRVLADVEAEESEPSRKGDVLVEMARVLETELGQHDAALAHYARVLGLDPGRLDVARVLVDRYAALNESEGLVAALELIALYSQDSEESRGAMARMVSAYTEIEDFAEALDWAGRLFELSAREGELAGWEEIVQLAEKTADFEGAADALETGLGSVGSQPADSIEPYLALGDILWRKLQKGEDAGEWYERALDSDSTSTRALDGLQEIATVGGDWARLERVLALRGKHDPDDAGRLAAREQLGELYDTIFDEPEKALQAYQNALELNPGSNLALEGAVRILQQELRGPELMSLLERALPELEADELALRSFQLGELHREQEGGESDAVEYYQQCLSVDASHGGARAALEELTRQSPSARQAYAALEEVCRAAEDWAGLARALEGQLGGDSGRESDLLGELAQLYLTHLEQPADALPVLERLVREEPDNLDLVDRWIDAGVATGNLEAMLRYFDSNGDRSDWEWLGRLSRLHEATGDLGAAESVLSRVTDSGGADLLLRRADLAELAGEWERAYAVLLEVAGAREDEKEKLDLYSRAADLALGSGDAGLDRALSALRMAAEVAGPEGESTSQLRTLLMQRDRGPEYVDLDRFFLSRPSLERESALLILERLAVEAVNWMEAPEVAIEAYLDWLGRAEEEPVPEALEHLCAARMPENVVEAQWVSLLVAAQQYAGEVRDWDRELLFREGQLPYLPAEQKGPALVQMAARASDDLCVAELALEYVERALGYGMQDQPTLSLGYQLASELDRFNGFYESLDRKIGASGDVSNDLLFMAAELASDVLGRPEDAAEHYRTLLTRDCDEDDVLKRLDAVLTEAGEDVERLAVIARRAEMASGSEQSFLYQALASLSMMLGEDTLAVASWEEVRRHAATEEQAVHQSLVHLTELYSGTERWGHLLETLRERAAHGLETENRSELLLRAGRIAADDLNDPLEAAALFELTLERTPGIGGPWLELERAYRDASKWEELEGLYHRKVGLLELGDEWARVKRALAGLYQDTLPDADKLFSTVEELVQFEPDDPELEGWLRPLLEAPLGLAIGAFDLLKTYYEDCGDTEEWKGLMLEALSLDMGAERHQKIHLELAEMFEAEDDNLPSAWGHFLRAWELDLTDTVVWGELVRVTDALGGWDGLKDAIDTATAGVEEEDARVLLLERAARVYGEDAGRPETAAVFLEQSRQNGEPKAHILEELERLYEEAENWGALVGILGEQLHIGLDEERAQLIRMSLIRTLDQKLGDEDGALGHLSTVVDLDPGHRDARLLMEEILQRTPDPERMTAFYEDWLEGIGDDEEGLAVSGKLLGTLLRLGEGSSRVVEVALWRLERSRLDPIAVEALEKALVASADVEAIGPHLLGVYEESGQWQALLDLLQTWADEHDDAAERLGLYEQAYHVATRKLSDATRGLSIALSFVELQGGSEWVVKGEEHARETGDWEHWLDGLLDIAERSEVDEVAQSLLERVLEKGREIGGESPAYRRCLQMLVLQAPEDSAVIPELEDLLRQEEDWEGLLSHLEFRSSRSDEPGRKAECFLDAADVALLEMEDQRRGAEYFERILALDPKHDEALERMSGVLVDLEEWERLANHYRHWVGVTSDAATRSALRLRRAALCAEPLEWRVEAAQEALLALEESGGEMGGAVEFLVELLETIDPRETMADGEFARRTVALAVQKHSHVLDDDWLRQGRVYSALLETTSDVDEQATLLREFGLGTWRRGGDPAGGYSRLCASLYRRLDWDLLEDVLECAEMADMHVEYRDLVAELGEKHIEDREALLLKAATYSLFPLRDGVSAAAFYEQILARNPGHGPALDALEAYHRESGHQKGVRLVLRKRLALPDSAERKGDYWLELGDLELEAGSADKAVAAYEEARRCLPGSPLALTALEPLYRQRENWVALERVMRARLELLESPAEQYSLLMEMGRMLAENAGQSSSAQQVFQEASSMEEGAVDPLRELAALHREHGRWSSLAKTLEKEQALLEPGEGRAGVTVEIGRLYCEKLGAVERGMEQYRLALTEHPEGQDALFALQALLGDAHHQLPAALFLDSHYEAQGRYEELLNVLEIQRKHAASPEEVLTITERLATTLEEELLAPEKAMEALVEGIRSGVPFDSVRPSMSRIADAHSMWPETLHALAHASDGMKDGGLFVLQWCASAWEERLGQLEESAVLLERCWNLAPGERVVFGKLTDLLERLGHWAELADVLERDCRLSPLTQTRLRLGRVLKDGLRDPAGAFDVFKRLLLDGKDSQECEEELEVLAWEFPEIRSRVVELLRPVFEARRDREGEMRLLDLMSETDAEGRADALWEGGALAISAFGDEGGGLSRKLESVKLANAIRGDRLQLVTDLAREHSRLGDVVAVLEHLSADGGVGKDSIEVLSRLGRLWLEMGEQGRAEEVLEKLLFIDETHPYTLQTLRELYRAANRQDELRDVCLKELRGTVTLEQRAELLRLVADAAVGLGDTKGAIAALEELQGLDLAGVPELETLALLYEGMGMDSFLLMTLERLALHAGLDAQRSLDVKLRLASLEESHGGGSDRATRWYEDILELEPGHWEALTALERLYRSRKEWEGLIEVIGRLANETEARIRKVELWKERAIIAENELGKFEEAEKSLREALHIEPGDQEATDELVRLLHKRSRWEDLFQLYESKLDRMPRGQSWNELALKAVTVAVDGLGQPDKALQLLSELSSDGNPGTAVCLAYGKLTYQQGNREEAERLFGQALEVAEHEQERVEALVALGELHVAKGDAHREAMEFLLQAVDLSPYHQGVNDLLSQVYRSRGRWDALVGVLKRQLEGLERLEEQASMCLQISEVYMDSLEKPELAVPFLERAHSLAPQLDEALKMLVDVLAAQSEFLPLLPLVREWVARLRDRKAYDELSRYAFILGQCEEAFGTVEAAEGAYRTAYRRDPTHVETLVRLSTLLLEQGENTEALPILQALQLRQHHLSGGQKVFVFFALAQVWMADGDERRALQFVRRTLKADPSHEGGRALLETLRPEN